MNRFIKSLAAFFYSLIIGSLCLHAPTSYSASVVTEDVDQCRINSDTGAIGRVRIGMTFSEVQSVGLPQKKEEVHFEGDSYNIIYVLQCAGGAISGLFGSDAKIARIETFSPQFSSSAGVGVGSSLRAIKLAYPDGNLIFGVADGRYLRYLTHTHLIFDFDPNLLPSSCYTKKDSGCSLRDVDAARKVVVDQQIARI